MSEKIDFQVGQKYENMKGVYEVISITRDLMTIRWENGDQTSTPVDLQCRIIERMLKEKQEIDEKRIENQSKKPKHRNTKSSKGDQPKEFELN
jgi:hypothetical protein